MTKRVLKIMLSAVTLLSIIFTSIVIVSAEEIPAFDETKPYIKASSTPVRAGETATVTFEIGNNPGFWGLRHTFTFNQDVLSLVPSETNQYGTFPQFTAGAKFSNSLVSPISNGDLIFLYTSVGATDISTNKSNGMLFSVDFKVADDAEPGVYNIDIKDYSSSNVISLSGNPVEFTYNQACVTVYDDTHTHIYTEKITKEPTCIETGVKTFTCFCGDTYTEDIQATGIHSFVNGKCEWCDEPEPIKIIYGDVNDDRNVDEQDIEVLAKYIAKWKGYEDDKINIKAADVNEDGKVNSLDRTILSRHLANWEGYEELPFNP